MECSCECVEDAGGGAGDLSSLETGVVLDAEPRDGRDLTAPQPRHATRAYRRQADLVGGEAGAASGEELTDLCSVVHAVEGMPMPPRLRGVRGALSVHPSTG